jgi:hypothetical protein
MELHDAGRPRGRRHLRALLETCEAVDAVDAAYDTTCGRRYPAIVPSILAPDARAATLELVPL